VDEAASDEVSVAGAVDEEVEAAVGVEGQDLGFCGHPWLTIGLEEGPGATGGPAVVLDCG
jgi:hypothetical protein